MKPTAQSKTIQTNRAFFWLSIVGAVLGYAALNLDSLALSEATLSTVRFVTGACSAGVAVAIANIKLRLGTTQAVEGESTLKALVNPRKA